jgi:beta-glucosidase/6-phospho-beta-glucosidase/beta-galactosidase
MSPGRLFKSFWLAGFESACHITRANVRLDMLAATQHDRWAEQDYARLKSIGIQTARDGLRWHLVERGGRFDFSSVAPMVRAAQKQGIQVIWSLCHFGWPDDLDLFSPAFVTRFARYCGAVARFIADNSSGIPLYTPINEISFLSWAAGDVAYLYPFAHGRAAEVKRQLVRAVIAGSEAIWAVDRRARIVHVEPGIHIVPPRDRPDLGPEVARIRDTQFEAWDMLGGVLEPGLGGHPRYLDVLGVNFYHDNQWEHPSGSRLQWAGRPLDERRIGLHQLLAEAYARYRRPVLVGETSHFGSDRVAWLREIAEEVRQAFSMGVPLEGVCIYPILDRPDWENPHHWHTSGLWDLHPGEDGTLDRVLNAEYAAELKRVQYDDRSVEAPHANR